MLLGSISYAADYSFEIPQVESKKEILELSGNLDVKYSIFKIRNNSPMYSLQYYGRQLPDILSSYRMEYYLNGDYQTRDIGVHLKTQAEYYNDKTSYFNLYELYGDVNLSANSFLHMGKKMYNWGKGYAFNPVGYVNSAKNPENPELSQAGLFSVNYEYSKSFQTKTINNIAFDLIVIPSENTVNNKISEIENTAIAGKLYLLLLDTDVDFMQYYSKVNLKKSGMDFSRNILTGLEIHGELSLLRNQPTYLISNNALETKHIEGTSYLFGLRWLNAWNITTILEYYHNDAGLSVKEFEDYNNYLVNAIISGNTDSLSNALKTAISNFNGTNLMQDYLYLKISWPEPFNWVYFTPSIYAVINTNDRSSMMGMPISYKPITNLEFIFWPAFFAGSINSEFGSKQYENKLDLWMRFYF
ncbi:MAG: hypothetical protein A2252_03985 [Elusimicrobia bacterium RIFOXYA2_FULL_39_19]|nr:MAG: hypothetical protein A2252_03985 [Elusimicrobia bacterium RIFOXYA2_FULL_39_19]